MYFYQTCPLDFGVDFKWSVKKKKNVLVLHQLILYFLLNLLLEQVKLKKKNK